MISNAANNYTRPYRKSLQIGIKKMFKSGWFILTCKSIKPIS